MKTLSILYTNDVHGNIDNFARAVYAIKRTRAALEAEDHIVLVVDGGDMEERSVPESHITKGAVMYRLLKAAGYQASAVGNASAFIYGADCLKDAAKEGVPLVCANLLDGEQPTAGITPTLIINLPDLKIGLTGVTDPMDGMYEKLHNVQAADPLDIVHRRSAELRAQGCQVIGLLSHLGLKKDMELADSFPGVDFIIGGHSHDVLHKPLGAAGIPICQAGSHGNYWGRLDLELDIANRIRSAWGEIYPINDDMPMDEDTLETWMNIRYELIDRLDTPIARLPQDFLLDYTQPCGAGLLVAKAIHTGARAEITMILAGHIHRPFLEGKLSRRYLCAALPSPFIPVVINLSGAEVVDILGRSVDQRHERQRAFRGAPAGAMQTVGLTYSLESGKLENVRVNGLPIQPEKVYRVAATYFLFEAGREIYTPTIDPARFQIAVHASLQEVMEAYLGRLYPVGDAARA
jgi:5'-nucleotidase